MSELAEPKKVYWTGRTYPGPDPIEGEAMFRRARALGISFKRATFLARVASFRVGYASRKYLCNGDFCTKTASRAAADGIAFGLITSFLVPPPERGKPPDKRHYPPGAKQPQIHGFAYRETVGWGKATAAFQGKITAAQAAERTDVLVNQARFAQMAKPPGPKHAAFPAGPRPPSPPKKPNRTRDWLEAYRALEAQGLSDAEIDAALRARFEPPDKPPD